MDILAAVGALGVILVITVVYNSLIESMKTKLTKERSKRDSLKIKVSDLKERLPSLKLEAEVLQGKVRMLTNAADDVPEASDGTPDEGDWV
ncbi:MAG: hypothetical protein AB7E47_14620 [Desulfovibrionaceae bacterium]